MSVLTMSQQKRNKNEIRIHKTSAQRNNLKMHQVMQAIQEHQAIDELGLGHIGDAFSNKLFPGISTLHNRAKYYAILPSLFLEAEKGTYKSANEVRAKVLNLEIKLTRQLLRGTEPANNWGITGSSVIDAAEAENSKYVKYDPVYIYYGALVSLWYDIDKQQHLQSYL